MFDTDELDTIAREAVSGELPVLTEDLGHDILGMLEVLNAPKKCFDTTISNVLMMDVLYEGDQLSPDTENLILSFQVGKETRQVKIHASHIFMLMDLLQEALPQDGV